MALSNTAVDTAPSDSSGLAKGKGGSPIGSGGTASKSVAPRDTRWEASVKRRPMNVELHQFPKPPVREGAKETTTHDFLSLYKNAAVTGKIETGILSPSITQDLLQPLEKCAQPIGGNIVTSGFLTPNGHMNHYRATNQNCYGGVQGAGHGHSNETRELPTKSMWMDGLERGLKGVKEDNHAHGSTSQLKFGTRELGHVAKTGPTHSHLEVGQQHTSSPIQEWEHRGSGFCNMVKEPHIVTPKGMKDEEYSDCDDESEKKEVLIQKGDAVQKMDGKNNDCKTNTPRSKHSATEQRRRSKINDRFQMLRQLVPNTDQKRDKASFLLEVIEYIQVLQEKLNKCEATEHGRQQERLKTIAWELPQRNSGLQDFTPIVSTVPSDWKKATDNQLGRPKSTSVVAAGEYGSLGDISLPVDRAIEESHYGHPNHEKVAFSMSTPVSLSGQHPPFGRDSNLPNISVLRSVTESHMPSYPRPDGEILVPPSINKIETLLPVPYKNSRAPAQLMWGMDEKWQHELENKTYGFCQQDTNRETCNKDSANGKGNSGLELEPPVAGPFIGLLQNKDAYVSKHNGGVKTTIMHKPETLQRGVTSASLQEPVIIQGDNVNVSSVYSQKLLDTLKKEFQCSGFDLSKTSISVQINLGKAANQSTEIQQPSAGHGKHPAPQAREGLNKRPKIVSES